MVSDSNAPVIVVAPDSFKGSLSASEVADALAYGVSCALPNAIVRRCPMADGGEGTLDAMLSKEGLRKSVLVSGASGCPLNVEVGLLVDGTAVIEVASIVGITEMTGMGAPVQERSTRGVGEVIRWCLDDGCRRFYIALGGSSTNEAGAGMLVALGLRIYDAYGSALSPTLADMKHIALVDVTQLDRRLLEVEIVCLTDVDNPLAGDGGATAIFGKQKGVDPASVDMYDAVISRFAHMLETALGRTASNAAGAGAAGGLGFALQMLGGTCAPGAEVVAAQVGLDAALQTADWVITGEGRSDEQTMFGKAPFVVSLHAQRLGIPTTLLSGAVATTALRTLNAHFAGCFSAAPGPITLAEALRNARHLLSNQAEQMTRLRFIA